MKNLTIKLPISIQPTANNDGYIIIDAEGTEYYFYNQEGTTELEYDGFSTAIKIKVRSKLINKEIVVPEGYYDQDSKDFEQVSLNDFKDEETLFRRQYMWDLDLQRLGLSSRQFTNGSEFGDIIYRLQKPGENIRWCVFSVDRNYYISKEKNDRNNGWCEVWTKQMDKDLEVAKKYCEDDAFKIFIGIEVHLCDNCKYRLDFKEAPCLVCESKSINSI
jgi:hypothetical protein